MNEILSPETTAFHPEPLLRSNDVARILNISRSQAYALMQENEIPVVRIGRVVRVRRQDLEAFILSRISST
jgi:excisionase family DNA binding protein